MTLTDYLIQPLTPDRWDDFVTLFGPHGAMGGCWCMFWRREGAWQAKNGDENREKMHALVGGGSVTGLLAYSGDQVVEAYPMDKEGSLADVSSYMGVMKPFLDEGFVEVARRSEHHAVVRKSVRREG